MKNNPETSTKALSENFQKTDLQELSAKNINLYHKHFLPKREDFNGDLHDESIFLAAYVDQYLDYINPSEKNLQKFKDLRSTFFENFIKKGNIGKKHIASAEIFKTGLLEVVFEDGSVETINIIAEWDEQIFGPERAAIHKQTREQEEKLQENVAKEAFFNGSVVAEYVAGSTVAGMSVVGVGSLTRKINFSDKSIFAIKSIETTTEIGKQRIDFKKPFVGTKQELADSIQKIVNSVWYSVDRAGKIFSPQYRSLNRAVKNFPNLTYDEYKKSSYFDAKITEADFNAEKPKIIAKLQKVADDVKSGKTAHNMIAKNLDNVFSHSLKAAMIALPFVFFDYTRDQTMASFYKNIAEELGFAAGFKVGSKIPWAWGKVAGIGLGLGAVIGGSVAFDAMLGATKQKWKYFEESNYSDGKGIAGHFLGTGLYEVLDGFNKIKQATVGGKEFDIGIDRTRISVPLLGGKDFHIGTIPEVTFLGQKIHFGIEPHEWMMRVMLKDRDVDAWNRKVDDFKISLTRDVYELLGRYFRNQSMFGSDSKIKEAGSKENLLKENLREIMTQGEAGDVFEKNINAIIDGIIEDLPNLSDKKIPNSYINSLINTNVEAMKIDNFYLNSADLRLNQMSTSLFTSADQLAKNETEKKYLQSLPNRMLANQKLKQTPEEEAMYSAIIDSTEKITIDNKEMERGEMFAFFLEQSAKWKNEQYFLSQLQKWNMHWFEWNIGFH